MMSIEEKYNSEEYQDQLRVVIDWAVNKMSINAVHVVDARQADAIKDVWDAIRVSGELAEVPFYLVFSEDHTKIKKRELGGGY